MTESPHVPVLLNEVLKSFSLCRSGYLIDCTLGYAGHSAALLKALPHVSLVGIDRDTEALQFSEKKLQPFSGRYLLRKGDFATAIKTVTEEPVVGILADFGVSSLQLDKYERGFSFESECLDMRMDQHDSLTAHTVVNTYSQAHLARIFRDYGELSQAEQLAAEIVKRRTLSPILSAKSLSKIAKEILYHKGKIHPATRMFQAIRIEVNNELGQIKGLLESLEEIRPAGTVVSLITFHSLEDRLVKNYFRKWSRSCICDPRAPRCTCGKNHALGKILTKKPITAGDRELKENPRSRSAKLRSFCFRKAIL